MIAPGVTAVVMSVQFRLGQIWQHKRQNGNCNSMVEYRGGRESNEIDPRQFPTEAKLLPEHDNRGHAEENHRSLSCQYTNAATGCSRRLRTASIKPRRRTKCWVHPGARRQAPQPISGGNPMPCPVPWSAKLRGRANGKD